MAKKKVTEVGEEEVDAMDVVNDLSLEEFVDRYVMNGYGPIHLSTPSASKISKNA
jgi:hypothetical protein